MLAFIGTLEIRNGLLKKMASTLDISTPPKMLQLPIIWRIDGLFPRQVMPPHHNRARHQSDDADWLCKGRNPVQHFHRALRRLECLNDVLCV